MDTMHLEYFIEVARQKNFSKAAEILHISQPSVSKAIKDLETQLGVTLFYRNTKFVELTDSGRAILEQAQQIVSSVHNITARLDGLTKLQSGKIHIGLPPITGITPFSKLLGLFKQEYPNITIQLFEYGAKKIEPAINDGLLDFGISIPPEDSSTFERISFSWDSLQIIMNQDNPLSHDKVIDFATLREEQFILYDQDFKLHDKIIARCKEAGFYPKIVFETGQRELMVQMVAANLGIALLPSAICKEFDSKAVISRSFNDSQIYLELALVWKRERYLSHAVREFFKFAKDFFAAESSAPHLFKI
ncbi:MAG: LysR family transcriptional regulator [Sporomusaceae bacterium]|nr:LysR family transcriptional regulator [Sporomusaceae bacterium]